jgi:hypothetical protein
MCSQRRADPGKVKQNILDSKLPECAVNEYLINLGFPNIPGNPDFKVYKRGEKSWAPDLIYNVDKPWSIVSDSNVLNIAVKSCTTAVASKFKASYIFNLGTDTYPNTIEKAISGEKNSGLDDLFINGTDSDVVAFVLFDANTMTCELRGFVNWSYLKADYKNAFGEMRLAKFKNIKTAIYDEYLQSLIKNPRMFVDIVEENSKEKVQTTVRIPEELHTSARIHCFKNKITFSDYVEFLLRKELDS